MEGTTIRKVNLSMDEQKEYEVSKSLTDHPTPYKRRSAIILDCTIRHINHILKGYKEREKAYFIQGNRGRKSANPIPDKIRNLVIDLYRMKYYDANFEHFTELLGRYEETHFSPSSVMSILEADFTLSPKATKAKKKRIHGQLKSAKTQKEATQCKLRFPNQLLLTLLIIFKYTHFYRLRSVLPQKISQYIFFDTFRHRLFDGQFYIVILGYIYTTSINQKHISHCTSSADYPSCLL